MSSPMRPDRVGLGSKPVAIYATPGEQILNIAGDVTRIAIAIGDKTNRENAYYRTGFDAINSAKLQMAQSPVAVTSAPMAETKALIALNEGEIAFTDAYEMSLPLNKDGTRPAGRRRADSLSQGHVTRACIPVLTTLAGEAAPAKMSPALRRLYIEERIRFVCIVKGPDSGADVSGNTTGRVSGPGSIKNTGVETIYGGQLMKASVVDEATMKLSKGDPTTREGKRPILLPTPVDFLEHDAQYVPRIRLALHNINVALELAMPGRRGDTLRGDDVGGRGHAIRPWVLTADQYRDVRSKLTTRYDRHIYDLFVDTAAVAIFGMTGTADAVASRDVPGNVAMRMAYGTADVMMRRYNQALPLPGKAPVRPNNGVAAGAPPVPDKDVELAHSQNLTRLVGTTRNIQASHDKLIFGRALETLVPGATGLCHILFYSS